MKYLTGILFNGLEIRIERFAHLVHALKRTNCKITSFLSLGFPRVSETAISSESSVGCSERNGGKKVTNFNQ